jgi:uncharacterized protein
LNYLIDGHNLISQIPGLDLRMPDDEQQLVELLILFCQHSRHKVEVYFDKAPFGQAVVTNHGRVQAHFVSQRSTADDAIRKKLKSLARSAKTWVLVSSDRNVQAAAREAHAQVLSSEEFSSMLQTRTSNTSMQPGHLNSSLTPEGPLSEAEVKEWEAIFKAKPK